MARKKSIIECVCPRCGIVHKLNLMWTGRGKPRKYCPNCKSTISTLSSGTDYTSAASRMK